MPMIAKNGAEPSYKGFLNQTSDIYGAVKIDQSMFSRLPLLLLVTLLVVTVVRVRQGQEQVANIPRIPKTYHKRSGLQEAPVISKDQKSSAYQTVTQWPYGEPWSSVIKEHSLDYVLLETSNCSTVNNSKEENLHVILVSNHPSALDRRRMIRDTWASPSALRSYKKIFKTRLLVFFVSGVAKDNPEANKLLKEESEKYRDIIQGNFVDSYRNLTFKATISMKWVLEFCGNVSYLIRINDDTFVNVYNLLETLSDFRKQNLPEKTIFGWVRRFKKVQRDSSDKRYTSEVDYAAEYFPPFVMAQFYIMTNSLVKFLYPRAIKARYFWQDDIFLQLLMLNNTDVMQYDMKSTIKLTYKDWTIDPLYYRKAISVHINNQSMYVQYSWWTDILATRNLLTDEDILRLKVAPS